MSDEQLPIQVDVRKLAANGVELTGFVAVKDMLRASEVLLNEDGKIDVCLLFHKDEFGHPIVTGKVQAEVEVTCQRCLSGMPLAIESAFELGVVWSDDHAQSLPKSLDPLIVGDEPLVLLTVVEDELLLSIPYTNYHVPEMCSAPVVYSTDKGDASALPDVEKPFKALGQLMSEKS